MSNVTPEAAAAAAGLSTPQLSALEQSGQVSAKINWPQLAVVLGLEPRKLQKIAEGWKPAEKDLTTWRELRCITSSANDITVNCYLIWDEVSREAALFDTGWDAQPILETIAAEGLQLRHLFFTHAHEDHIAALGGIREKFPKVRL